MANKSKTRNIPDGDIIWGAAEIGREIGVSTRAAFHLLACGRLPARQIGRRWVSSRSALRAYMSDLLAPDLTPPAPYTRKQRTAA